MDKLKLVVSWIKDYQAKNGEVRGWCWRRVRQGCQAAGLRAPSAGSAKEAFAVLSTDPGAFGWKKAERDAMGLLPDPCLMFFKGIRPWDSLSIQRFGHAAIWSAGKLYASKNYQMNSWWAKRLIGGFVVDT